MELKHSLKTLALFGAAAAGALAFASPAQAEVATILINDGNVPTTAGDFEDQSCDQVPEDRAAWEDGWVFVLPEAAGAEGNFISVTATYEDMLGNTVQFDTDADGGVVSGSGDNKAYILTPAGLTLVGAEAQVNDPDPGAQFNLTHACAGEAEVPEEEGSSTPAGEETTEPGEESSPVCEEPSSPEESAGTESSTPAGSETPCEEATSPAGSENLPTTGTPLTIALVSAAALAAGGAVLFMIQRRRRAAQDW